MKAMYDLGSTISRNAIYNTQVFSLKNVHQSALRT